MELKKKKLTDVCTIQYGYAFDSKKFSKDKNDIALIRIRNVKTGISDTYYSGEYNDSYIINKGDILIGMDGEFNIAKWKSEPALLNQRVCKVAGNAEIVEDYLQYYLSVELKEVERKTSFVTVKHLSAKALNAMELELHLYAEQENIANQLNVLGEIIKNRKIQLEEYDVLIKSRFVEMFGDPKENPNNWIELSLKEVLGGKTSNGFFAKKDNYCDDGNVSVLGVADIVNRMYSKIEDLPRANAVIKDFKKYEVKYGDMLFCRSSLVAEGIGKASIVPFNTPKNILFECHVIRVQLDLEKCIPEYVQMLTTTPYFRNQILRHAKTSTMTTIGQDGIVNNMILLPPVEEQRNFLEFIRRVDKLKIEVQKSLNETKVLFDSLMQEYFE